MNKIKIEFKALIINKESELSYTESYLREVEESETVKTVINDMREHIHNKNPYDKFEIRTLKVEVYVC